ncbi:MAG: hypothetical protein P1P72_05265 [ANME-2 cluster archaeon]|nr:hypothetical protein [ANME-2 cluster archaeon]
MDVTHQMAILHMPPGYQSAQNAITLNIKIPTLIVENVMIHMEDSTQGYYTVMGILALPVTLLQRTL